jgi:3-oxoadipate enol-lactonase
VSDVLTHRVDGDGPPLLLLNGGLTSMAAWDRVVARLAPAHRVVRCDLRGQLLTPGPPPPTIEGHARDVALLLDHLGLDRVHVAGTSLGAFVGLRLAADRPERVWSLAAIAATDRIDGDEARVVRGLREACRAGAERGDGGAVLDALAERAFSPAWRAAHGAVLAERRRVIGRLPAEWFRGIDRLLAELEGLDLRPLLPAVRCPVLVLAAEHDRTFPPGCSRALAAALPRATMDVVPGAGHSVVVEAPEAVAERLQSFLARCGREGVHS